MNRNSAILAITTLIILAFALDFSCCATPILRESRSNSQGIELPDLEHDPGMYFLLAEQAEAQGDADGVLLYIRKALALDPTSAVSQHQDRYYPCPQP